MADADVDLLAVPASSAVEVVRTLGGAEDAMAGRLLIDCTNPIAPGTFDLTTSGPSMAEQIADAAPTSLVVKEFNLCHVGGGLDCRRRRRHS